MNSAKGRLYAANPSFQILVRILLIGRSKIITVLENGIQFHDKVVGNIEIIRGNEANLALVSSKANSLTRKNVK